MACALLYISSCSDLHEADHSLVKFEPALKPAQAFYALCSYTAINLMDMHYSCRKKRAYMIRRRINNMNNTSTIDLTDIELDPFDDAN